MGLRLPTVICQPSLRMDIDELVAAQFSGLRIAIVADANTDAALGALVLRALKKFNPEYMFLTPPPRADETTAQLVRDRAMRCDALIAVGGGTINDLCKYVAAQDGKPYMVFPTAASMNGYLSANASIEIDGYKKTLPARMPVAVLCDMGVIAAAPLRLAQSGLGDSIARSTAQADWLMSHMVLGTPYDERPFQLLSGIEPQLLDSARGIALRHAASLELLMHTLLLSGLGMTMARGSYPASQGEHMIAHAHEMLLTSRTRAQHETPTLHGEEIAVTTLYMAQLQEEMIRRAPTIRPVRFPTEALLELFAPQVVREAATVFEKKNDAIEQRAAGMDWNDVAARIAPVMLPPKQLHDVLSAAQSPTHHAKLGWGDEDFAQVCAHAHFLRDRFTFLDLVL
jgi:glycerol-1-phosphate dehydrogenase [NAD(P)+]